MKKTTKLNRLDVGRFNSVVRPAMILCAEPMIEPTCENMKKTVEENRPDVGRFNSVQPAMISLVEPVIEPTCKNMKKTIEKNRLDVGRFNYVEPVKPLAVPRLNELIRCRLVVCEDSIPKSESSP